MPRRAGLDGPPRSYLVEGPPEVHYAHQLAKRLRAAIGGRSLRDVARQARLDHTTVSAVLAGERWADLITIARLEVALGHRLWPDLNS
jgi:hypothetical protein